MSQISVYSDQLTILCVDNDKVILTSLAEQVRSHFGESFSYEMALGGENAFEALDDLTGEGIKTLVIISDWFMLGTKGNELLI